MWQKSIGGCALYASPKDLLNDPKTFGLLFKDLAVRDLRVYTESLGGKLMHYRDKNGLEVDVIAHLNDGRWGAIEIKLGSSEGVQEGAEHLLKFDELLAPGFKSLLSRWSSPRWARRVGWKTASMSARPTCSGIRGISFPRSPRSLPFLRAIS